MGEDWYMCRRRPQFARVAWMYAASSVSKLAERSCLCWIPSALLCLPMVMSLETDEAGIERPGSWTKLMPN